MRYTYLKILYFIKKKSYSTLAEYYVNIYFNKFFDIFKKKSFEESIAFVNEYKKNMLSNIEKDKIEFIFLHFLFGVVYKENKNYGEALNNFEKASDLLKYSHFRNSIISSENFDDYIKRINWEKNLENQ